MSVNKKTDFQLLYEAAIKTYPDKKKQTVQQDVVNIWERIKEGETSMEEEMKKLDSIQKRKKGNYLKFWGKASNPSAVSPKVAQEKLSTKLLEVPLDKTISESSEILKSEIVPKSPEKTTIVSDSTPAQRDTLQIISDVEKKIALLNDLKSNLGLSKEHKKELESLEKKRKTLKTKLNQLKSNQVSKRKQRMEKKRALEDIKMNHPEIAKKLKLQG